MAWEDASGFEFNRTDRQQVQGLEILALVNLQKKHRFFASGIIASAGWVSKELILHFLSRIKSQKEMEDLV